MGQAHDNGTFMQDAHWSPSKEDVPAEIDKRIMAQCVDPESSTRSMVRMGNPRGFVGTTHTPIRPDTPTVCNVEERGCWGMLTCRQAYITCADPLAVTQPSSTSSLANSITARPAHHPQARTMSAIINPNISWITFPPIEFTTLARRRIRQFLATESIEKAFVAEHLNDADSCTLRAWLFHGESPVDALVP